MSKLTKGEMVVAGSGILLLIFGFFKWYGVGGDLGAIADKLGVKSSFNGFQAPSAFLSFVAILIGVAAAAYVILTKLAGVDLPAKLGTLGMGFVLAIGGAVAFAFVVIKWIGNTSGTKIGIYGGLLTSAGLAVGGFLVAKERGELPAGMGGSGGGAAPPA